MEFTKENIKLICADNMKIMEQYPDNYFDWACVDPEYGIGASKPSKKPNKCKQKNGTILNVKSPVYKHKDWDNKPAGKEYFNEVFRISKNQTIWGVNNYDYNLTGGRIVWDKLNGNSDQFDCEIAYNSFNNRTDIVYYMWAGMFQGLNISKDIRKALIQQGNKKKNEKRIHPTQKPIKLYDWLYNEFGNKKMKIIDTNFGSGNSAISAYNFGFAEYLGIDIDSDYFNDAVKRFKNETMQQRLF